VREAVNWSSLDIWSQFYLVYKGERVSVVEEKAAELFAANQDSTVFILFFVR